MQHEQSISQAENTGWSFHVRLISTSNAGIAGGSKLDLLVSKRGPIYLVLHLLSKRVFPGNQTARHFKDLIHLYIRKYI